MSDERKGVEVIRDPRPDLAYDSWEWTTFLTLLNDVDPMLAGTLHGCRCGGLRIHRGSRGYALRPEFDPATSIWESEAEYIADRDKWLVPHADQIVSTLRFMDRHHKPKQTRRSVVGG